MRIVVNEFVDFEVKPKQAIIRCQNHELKVPNKNGHYVLEMERRESGEIGIGVAFPDVMNAMVSSGDSHPILYAWTTNVGIAVVPLVITGGMGGVSTYFYPFMRLMGEGNKDRALFVLVEAIKSCQNVKELSFLEDRIKNALKSYLIDTKGEKVVRYWAKEKGRELLDSLERDVEKLINVAVAIIVERRLMSIDDLDIRLSEGKEVINWLNGAWQNLKGYKLLVSSASFYAPLNTGIQYVLYRNPDGKLNARMFIVPPYRSLENFKHFSKLKKSFLKRVASQDTFEMVILNKNLDFEKLSVPEPVINEARQVVNEFQIIEYILNKF